mgnify:CR=1 FL=1
MVTPLWDNADGTDGWPAIADLDAVGFLVSLEIRTSAVTERADVVLGGLRFTVTHETGASAGRDERMAKTYPDTDVLVFGHSHIPWDTTTPRGVRLLNPGSPTDKRRQPRGVRRQPLRPGAEDGIRNL